MTRTRFDRRAMICGIARRISRRYQANEITDGDVIIGKWGCRLLDGLAGSGNYATEAAVLAVSKDDPEAPEWLRRGCTGQVVRSQFLRICRSVGEPEPVEKRQRQESLSFNVRPWITALASTVVGWMSRRWRGRKCG